MRIGICAPTTAERTWAKTPRQIDVAVVYPIDDLDTDDGSACLEDILGRGAKKILLVTSSNIVQQPRLDHFHPVTVEYDHESEDAHRRIKAHETESRARRSTGFLSKLPGYAQMADPTKLVRLNCDGCRGTSWAEMNVAYPGKATLQKAGRGAFKARCLKCNNEQTDCHKWYGNK